MTASRGWAGRWMWAAGAAWVVAALGACGFLLAVFIPRERAQATREWQTRLEATADDRAHDAAEWFEDGLRGVRYVAKALAQERGDGVTARAPAASPRVFDVPPTEATEGADFAGMWLYDRRGELVGMSPGVEPLAGRCLEVVRRASAAGATGADLRVCGDGVLRVLFACPLAGDGAPGEGDVVVLGADPALWLYPMLAREVAPTASGESVMVGRDGDEAVFLSPLRHATASPGELRLPLTTPSLPSPIALGGAAAVGRFVDYRGVSVLAATRPIRGSSFALVTKIDEVEVFARYREHVSETVFVVLAALLALGAAGLAAWRGSRAAHFKFLAASRAEIAELFEHGPDAGLVIAGGVITETNRAAGELFRCPPEALVGLFPWQLNPSEQSDGSSSETRLRTWISGLWPEQRRHFDWRCRRPDGSEFDAAISISVIDGVPPRALAWLRDVSEERAASERLRFLVEGSSRYFFYVQELDGSLSYVSPSVEAITGRPVEAWLQQSDWFTTANPINDEARRRTRAHLRGEVIPGPVLVEIAHASGRPLMLEVNEFGRYSGRRLVGLHGIAHDVTERAQAEAALRRSEERFRTLVTSLGEGVGVVDPDERLVQANPAAERIFGVGPGELAGRNLGEFVTPESMARIRVETQRRRAGETGSYEVEVVRADGSRRAILLTATPQVGSGGEFQGAFGIFRDVTEQRQLEGLLLHSQKMEAVGQLAGGIAHDFNNLLQAIMGLAQTVGLRAGDADFARGAARELAEHVRRGASLARQLLLFSRRETTRLGVVELNELLARGVSMLRRLVRENVEIRLAQAPGPLPVSGDHGQIEQVLINLAVNAADAMPDGGILTVRSGAGEDGEVWFEVADTGMGVPEAIKTRIFEPFFTTKGADKGTGLGLSVVHGIVAAHRGSIVVDSEVGRGSTFRVALPRSAPGDGVGAAPVADEEPPATRAAGTRILVVEDEPAARDSLVDLLGMLGYAVTAVESGEQAGVLPDEPAFDVLLTDFLLPGISGADLARGLTDRWPRLRVVLMSGYTEDGEVRAAVRSGTVRFLQKPFSIEALARELQAAMDGPATS